MAATALLLSLLCAGAGAQRNDAEQRVEGLAAATSLTKAGLKPWHLRLHYTLNGMDGKPLDTGTADLQWNAPDHDVLQVESTLFHGPLPAPDAAFASGTFRELYLLQELIDETIHPVTSLGVSSGLFFSEQSHKFGKTELRCLSAARNQAAARDLLSPAGSVFCVAPSDPDALRLHLESGVEIVRNRPATFQKISVAMDDAVTYSGQVLAVGRIELLEVTPQASAEEPSAAASGSIPLQSGALSGIHKLQGETPQYPIEARERHISGTVFLAGVIDAGGHLKDLTVIASPDASLTRSALSAVRTWTYTPTQLQGRPAAVATPLSVSYNLSPM